MEKMLEDCLKKNETLRTLFEEHPEKKEEYKFKILDSGPINDWHNNAIVHNPVGILGEAYGCRTKRKGNREHCHECFIVYILQIKIFTKLIRMCILGYIVTLCSSQPVKVIA